MSRVISETVTVRVPDAAGRAQPGTGDTESQPGSHDPTSAAGPAGPGAVMVSLSMSDPTVRLLARTSGGPAGPLAAGPSPTAT